MLRNCSVLLSSLLTILSAQASAADNNMSVQEASFKAALIYKMGSYLSWLPPKTEVNYCFIGPNNAIASVLLDKLNNGTLPKAIQVTQYEQFNIADLTSCHVIYAPDSSDIQAETLDDLPKDVFTISNNSRALEKGFIASIELYNKKPLLSISKHNLKSASVSVNSRFLSYVDLR